MITKKGWEEQLAMSLFLKEVTYNAGVTMTGANACSMDQFEADADWADRVESDKDSVTGKEFGNDQEIIAQMINLKYSEKRAMPNSLIGLAGLVFGSVTTSGAGTDKTHVIVPAGVSAATPSIQINHKKGGVQYGYTGVKGNSIEIKAEEGGPVSLSCEMMGSGSRATNATAFPAIIDESWLLAKNCKVWMESGADISIDASPVQDVESISSTTPDDIKARLKSFSYKFSNNNEGQPGFGGAGVYQDIDHGRRAAELSFQLRFVDAAELTHFINQNPLAIEFDLAGSVIPSGALKFGFQLIVPRFKLKKAPKAEGGPDDSLILTMDCEVFEDGTNPVTKLVGYNARTAYLA
jgi:hypothetical protein